MLGRVLTPTASEPGPRMTAGPTSLRACSLASITVPLAMPVMGSVTWVRRPRSHWGGAQQGRSRASEAVEVRVVMQS